MANMAKLVKTLRERTGAGMMDCKKALDETGGDIDAAFEVMRKSGVAKADKKAGRVAAEGIVGINIADNAAVICEINSETDFVSRDENFTGFADAVLATALTTQTSDINQLLAAPMGEHASVDEARKALVAKIGENISVRRVHTIKSDAVLGTYVHGGRIGVIVEVEGGSADLAKDLAMHIAASAPIVVSGDQVPADVIDTEKRILSESEDLQGKPDDIKEKMVTGRINKFVNEVSLLGQPFVKDPSQNVEAILKAHNAKVLQFVRFAVGEGIEKEEVNFAEEVAAQVQAS